MIMNCVEVDCKTIITQTIIRRETKLHVLFPKNCENKLI